MTTGGHDAFIPAASTESYFQPGARFGPQGIEIAFGIGVAHTETGGLQRQRIAKSR